METLEGELKAMGDEKSSISLSLQVGLDHAYICIHTYIHAYTYAASCKRTHRRSDQMAWRRCSWCWQMLSGDKSTLMEEVAVVRAERDEAKEALQVTRRKRLMYIYIIILLRGH